MVKKKLSKKKCVILIILTILITIVIVFFIPLTFNIILSLLFSAADTYLLADISFVSAYNITILITLFVAIFKMSKKYNIKDFIKKYKIFCVICILIFVIMEAGCLDHIYASYKDIKEGKQEEIMTNAVVRRRRVQRYSKIEYIEGYIDGEKIRLSLGLEANSILKENERYKKIKIKYYKNIKKLCDVEFIY